MRSADNQEANYSLNFEINGSRPSTSSLSPFSPLLLISRNSFSYGKLPLEPIRLNVLKLDGSSFDITVAKNPTVAQLKQAVEDAFSHLPDNRITGKVSWPHVWAQFCLCFNGEKLLHDQDGGVNLGIKDGDQLQFVRHTSISYNFIKERSEKHDHNLQKRTPNRQVHVLKHEEEQDSLNQHNKENETDSNDDFDRVNITCQCSWGHLWKRLFSRKHHDTNYAELATS
ncbi:hypothetical protein QVD17_39606 [Tagetes erecta]|uniref:SNRNP25 ubiquitin-like domain-containing protein n=1 Tax=Tagetes erecta TaxID=13708 RepID=A0AAD8JQC5_TARER|nr:hypothetical protein QVD17_39606 [Tagetes erecta]